MRITLSQGANANVVGRSPASICRREFTNDVVHLLCPSYIKASASAIEPTIAVFDLIHRVMKQTYRLGGLPRHW
ncbi:MAG: hypothetical protein ACJAWT_000787 [Glaciecola sp.]|jgi:hypothetical protein